MIKKLIGFIAAVAVIAIIVIVIIRRDKFQSMIPCNAIEHPIPAPAITEQPVQASGPINAADSTAAIDVIEPQ